MDFDFSEEQDMLRDMLAAFLRDRYTFEDRRAAVRAGRGRAFALWPSLAGELGILGASLPEGVGGLGGGRTENMIVMEELGKALSLEPWLATIVMAPSLLLGTGDLAKSTLQAVIAGGAIVVPAIDYFPQAYGRKDSGVTHVAANGGFSLSGQVPLVRDPDRASHFVFASGSNGPTSRALFLIQADAPGISAVDYQLVDGTRVADLILTDVSATSAALITEGADAVRRTEAAFDSGVAALCAESLGIQRMLLHWTVAYSKERQQFGRPIGQFQVLKHRMAEMFIKVEEAASMTYLATVRLAEVPAERAKIVSAAKVACDQSARFVGQQAVQIHGAMGLSKELPIADYFSRLTVIAQQLGSTDYHLSRYEAASFGTQAA